MFLVAVAPALSGDPVEFLKCDEYGDPRSFSLVREAHKAYICGTRSEAHEFAHRATEHYRRKANIIPLRNINREQQCVNFG